MLKSAFYSGLASELSKVAVFRGLWSRVNTTKSMQMRRRPGLNTLVSTTAKLHNKPLKTR